MFNPSNLAPVEVISITPDNTLMACCAETSVTPDQAAEWLNEEVPATSELGLWLAVSEEDLRHSMARGLIFIAMNGTLTYPAPCPSFPGARHHFFIES
jgi:hypothetical protein